MMKPALPAAQPAWGLFWLGLNTAYSMEFFLQEPLTPHLLTDFLQLSSDLDSMTIDTCTQCAGPLINPD